MNKTCIYIFLLLLLGIDVKSQEKEFVFYINNGILLNKRNMNVVYGDKFAMSSNTLSQALGVDYKYIAKSNISLGVGVSVGYEFYKFQVNYPFEKYGYTKVTASNEAYNPKTMILYSNLHFDLGYRFRLSKSVKMELKAGQAVQLPHGFKYLYFSSKEQSSSGFLDENFSSEGYIGKGEKDAVLFEFPNYIYLGINKAISKSRNVNIGLQFQKQILLADNPINYYKVTYYDSFGRERSESVFKGKHELVSLVLGYVF